MRYIFAFAFIAILGIVNGSNAQHVSKYAGQEARSIKSLSKDDIKELSKGAGWGLAKPAELNGVPGPAHILELADQIELSDEQLQLIKEEYADMRHHAIEHGLKYIEAERQIDALFVSGSVDATSLKTALLVSEKAHTELRFVHLSAHLKMLEIISPSQIQKYNELRGYESSDPCQNIPEGHNLEMWKKHNNCE